MNATSKLSTPAPLTVVRTLRDALARVPGGSVILSRDEFEAIANAIEKQPAPTLPPETKVKTDAGSLPGGLSPEQLKAMLIEGRTVKTLCRLTGLSVGTINRALASLPGVEVISHRERKHTRGRRPFVYAVTATH